MLGPVGAVSYMDRAWQGTFGAQVMGVRVRERATLSSLGLAFGGLRYTTAERGRAWADLLLGTRVLGVHVGLSIGPTIELDRVIPPNWGAHATLWVFAGVVPFARVGAVQDRGTFVELGLELMLPAWRM